MLQTGTTDALPIIPRGERDKLADLPEEEHSEALGGQVFAKTVEVRQAPSIDPPAPACRAVAWNVERCYHTGASAELLASLQADVFLLSEMDYGMARTDQEHTTARLAEKLGCGYVYGVEYLQFGLGTYEERARCRGQTNRVGYHGNAILSRRKLKRPALVRLEESGDWFKRELEPRLGGRVAVLATIEINGSDVVFASVHLEDRTDPDGRSRQMANLLRSIEEYASGSAVVIGGDLNTFSFDLHRFSADLAHIRKLFAEDPERLLRPETHEPLFSLAEEYGYDWKRCNRLGESTQRSSAKPLSMPGNKKLDWFLTRGLTASEPAIVAATPGDIAWPLSDHELISVKLDRPL